MLYSINYLATANQGLVVILMGHKLTIEDDDDDDDENDDKTDYGRLDGH